MTKSEFFICFSVNIYQTNVLVLSFFDFVFFFCLFAFWGNSLMFCALQSDRYDGYGTMLCINNISHFQNAPEWIEPFRALRLSRMRNDAFEECFEKNAKGLWKLKNGFSNALPGTDSIFVKSLFSISYKELLIQDVRLTKDGPELIEGKFFDLPIEYASTKLRLNDNIGILIIGTWDKPEKQRKYLALDCFARYYPIIYDEIILHKE